MVHIFEHNFLWKCYLFIQGKIQGDATAAKLQCSTQIWLTLISRVSFIVSKNVVNKILTPDQK